MIFLKKPNSGGVGGGAQRKGEGGGGRGRTDCNFTFIFLFTTIFYFSRIKIIEFFICKFS